MSLKVVTKGFRQRFYTNSCKWFYMELH